MVDRECGRCPYLTGGEKEPVFSEKSQVERALPGGKVTEGGLEEEHVSLSTLIGQA